MAFDKFLLIAVIALSKLLSCSIIKAGPWLTLPLIYVPMLLLRLKVWGYSSAVPGGPAMAHQNNFYHDASLTTWKPG